MGFSSKQCQECEYSILSNYVTTATNHWMNHVVAITPDERIVTGSYDGYCRIVDEDEESDNDSFFEATVYHEACWIAAGRPSGYLGEGNWSEDQGYFFDKADYEIARPAIA